VHAATQHEEIRADCPDVEVPVVPHSTRTDLDILALPSISSEHIVVTDAHTALADKNVESINASVDENQCPNPNQHTLTTVAVFVSLSEAAASSQVKQEKVGRAAVVADTQTFIEASFEETAELTLSVFLEDGQGRKFLTDYNFDLSQYLEVPVSGLTGGLLAHTPELAEEGSWWDWLCTSVWLCGVGARKPKKI
jgi:hypothetical protein